MTFITADSHGSGRASTGLELTQSLMQSNGLAHVRGRGAKQIVLNGRGSNIPVQRERWRKGVLMTTQMEVSRMTGPSGPIAKDDRGSVGEVAQLVKYYAW